MAVPLSPDRIFAALHAEGVRIQEHRSWRTHSRNHKGPWGPVHGVMLHHTVSKGELSSVELCYNGYEGLPGPLCHVVIPKSGTTYLVSAGRSNHAGGGDPNVLQAVKDERYNDAPPRPTVGNTSGIDGNAHFYGAECVNMGDGKDPWEPDQVDAMVRWAAALCRAHGWTEKSVIGHREWSRDKSDPFGPGMPTMTVMRAKIAERLAHPASWNPTTTTTGTPMTAPARSLLRRTENMTLLHGVPQTLYWTTEYPDDANGHGEGGKTVGSNIRYNGLLNLRITGLGLGEVVEVYAAEEDANGAHMGDSEIRHQIDGRMEGYHPIAHSAPVHGHVGNRLVFKVVAYADNAVTIEEAWLSLHSWPNS